MAVALRMGVPWLTARSAGPPGISRTNCVFQGSRLEVLQCVYSIAFFVHSAMRMALGLFDIKGREHDRTRKLLTCWSLYYYIVMHSMSHQVIIDTGGLYLQYSAR